MTALNCHQCHQPTDARLIDGKDDGSGNYTILLCPDCYGPGWLPQSMKDARRNSAAWLNTRRLRQS
jgi:hypothetical protein